MENAANKFLARFGTQLRDGNRILAARARAKTELAWNRLNDLYQTWDDIRWSAPTFAEDARKAGNAMPSTVKGR